MQIIILAILIALAACGGGSSGSTGSAASLGLADVAGTYALESTDCSEAFDDTVTVTQNGNDITVTPNDEDNYLAASGALSSDDTFTLSNTNGTCVGVVYPTQGFVYLECNLNGLECMATYDERSPS